MDGLHRVLMFTQPTDSQGGFTGTNRQANGCVKARQTNLFTDRQNEKTEASIFLLSDMDCLQRVLLFTQSPQIVRAPSQVLTDGLEVNKTTELQTDRRWPSSVCLTWAVYREPSGSHSPQVARANWQTNRWVKGWQTNLFYRRRRHPSLRSLTWIRGLFSHNETKDSSKVPMALLPEETCEVDKIMFSYSFGRKTS